MAAAPGVRTYLLGWNPLPGRDRTHRSVDSGGNLKCSNRFGGISQPVETILAHVTNGGRHWSFR